MTTPIFPAEVLDMKPATPAVAMPVESSALWLAIDAATVDTNSSWIDVQPFSNFAIEVLNTDSATFSIQLYGSCSLEQPDLVNLTGSALLTDPLVAVGISFQKFPGLRWLQVQTSSVATGSVTVNVSANAP